MRVLKDGTPGTEPLQPLRCGNYFWTVLTFFLVEPSKNGALRHLLEAFPESSGP